jgi:hypothetical protein
MAAGDRLWPRVAAGDWFPERHGISDHPLVVESGRREAVLAALLLGYLDFTVRLELNCVVAVSRDLVMRRLDADYGAPLVRDALRVQCDEAFHALLCEELSEHAAAATALDRGGFPEHFFFRRTAELSARVRNALSAEQYAFCVAVVSETAITDSLGKDWRDGSLRPEVRDVLRHHYRDEIRHTNFFSKVLQILWPQWTAPVREAMAPIWPELVLAFLRVDRDVTAAALTKAGFTVETARQIFVDSLSVEGALSERRASLRLTLRALKKAGVLRGDSDDQQFADRLSAVSEDAC